MNDPYAEITAAIIEAGFFVLQPHADEPFPRICPASKRCKEGGLTGNSFWIAKLKDRWFVGAWGGMIYLIPDPKRIGEFSNEWLSFKPNGTSADFDDWIIRKYHLSEFDNDEFDRLIEGG